MAYLIDSFLFQIGSIRSGEGALLVARYISVSIPDWFD